MGNTNDSINKRRKLRLEDIQNVMTKEEMAAFLSACRIRFGTAEPEDYVIVARYERMLFSRKRHDATGSN